MAKETVPQKLDYLRAKVRNLKYLYSSGGSFQEALDEFEAIFHVIDTVEELSKTKTNSPQTENY